LNVGLKIMPKTSSWTAGTIVEIELPGAWAYAKVLQFPLMAFYAARPERIAAARDLQGERFAFRIWVMKSSLGKKGWPAIGSAPLSADEASEPWFFKKDSISGRLTKYRDSTSEEFPATVADCAGLECAAVWDPAHVESRLRDDFSGRPNAWVESMKAR
jgi:hypothetical protein